MSNRFAIHMRCHKFGSTIRLIIDTLQRNTAVRGKNLKSEMYSDLCRPLGTSITM